MSQMKVISALALAGMFALPVIGHAAPKLGRISPAQAEAAAVKKIPGKATSAKYEFEDGHWQYAVIVRKGGAMYEVEVNAQTGRVTDTERTSAAEERSEAAADAKAAMHTRRGAHSNAPMTEEKGEAGEGSDAGEKG